MIIITVEAVFRFCRRQKNGRQRSDNFSSINITDINSISIEPKVPFQNISKSLKSLEKSDEEFLITLT